MSDTLPSSFVQASEATSPGGAPRSASAYSVEVCCASLNRPKELVRLRNSLPPDCTFSTATEKDPSFPRLANDLFFRSTADIVIIASDHLEFRSECIEAVRECFERNFPDLDGVVGLNVCNLPHVAKVTEFCFPAVGRRFIKRFYAGGIYQGLFCPEYFHFYADTELGLFAESVSKFYYEERAAVFTWSPNAGNAQPDQTHAWSRSRKDYDDTMWTSRRAAKLFWGESFEKAGDRVSGVNVKEAEPSKTAERGDRRQTVKADHPTSESAAENTERRVPIPLIGTELDCFINSLSETDVVTVPDSEDPRSDALKLRLFELDHVGRDLRTGKQTWRGAIRQRPSCPVLTAGVDLPTIISFYTIGTPYQAAAEKLEASCRECVVPFVIEGVPTRGSWESNCAFKPQFILERWRVLRRPVLWVDADALLRRAPGLLAGTTTDFAIHKMNRWEFASGTVFFNQTENARRLLECWIRRCEADPAVWDQQHLDAAWQEIADEYPLRTLWLPQSYTKIFDRAVGPGEDPLPVIEHLQASRELKQQISNSAVTPFRVFTPEFMAARATSRPFRSVPETQFVCGTSVELDVWADELMTVAGPGRTLIAMPGAGALVKSLLRRGVDVWGLDTASPAEICFDDGRCVGSALAQLPWERGPFQSAFLAGVLDDLPRKELQELMHRLSDAVESTLYVRTRGPALLSCEPRNRAWWEGLFLEAGYRKHPLRLHVLPYERIEQDQSTLVMTFERIAQAGQVYDKAKGNSSNHRDPTRQPGSLADAFLARYELAVPLIRPWDTVLDLGCGCGGGTHLLHRATRASRFIAVDPDPTSIDYARAHFDGKVNELQCQDVSEVLLELPETSVSFAICAPELAAAAAVDGLLCGMERVLAPGGRVVFVVASGGGGWLTRRSLESALEGRFLLEALYQQSGPSQPNGPGLLQKCSLDKVGDSPADAWIIVAMKDPVCANPPPYRETVFQHVAQSGHPSLRYAEFYRNPWLLHPLMHAGYRSTTPPILVDSGARLLQAAPPESADYGAALCLLVYRLIDGSLSADGAAGGIVLKCQDYLKIASPNAHQLRWQISLACALGVLHTQSGEFSAARQWFETCAQMDPLAFSTHLSTKTSEALFWSGWLAYTNGNSSAAESAWQRGLQFGERLMGRPLEETLMNRDWPNLFDYGDGMRELICALENVAKCANGLHCLRLQERGISVRWDLVHNSFRFQYERSAQALRLAQWRVEALCREVTEERSRPRDQSAELDQTRQALRDRTAELDRDRQALRDRTAELDRDRQALRERGAELEQSRQEAQRCARMAQDLHQRLQQASDELKRLKSPNARKGR